MADQQPSKSPSDAEGGFAGMLRLAFRKLMQETQGQLPATVVSYDDVSNTATVRPSIMIVGTEGETLGRAPLAQIPVLSLGGGGYAIRFPLNAGDTGWIEASDRDISLFIQAVTKRDVRPIAERMHSFSDGRFVPDTFRAAVLSDENKTRFVIQSLDGSQYIALGADGVHIKASALKVDAPAEFTQPVTMPAGASIGGIPFGTHKHSNVQNGPNTSGGPVA